MSVLEFESFDDVMHNKIVVVPDYQRDYSWSNAELRTLAEDIRGLYERNLTGGDHKHFIGSIVLIPLDESISHTAKAIASNPKLNKYGKYNIIDGQQRISTISILFIAIRDYAASRGIELEEDVKSMIDTGKKDDEGNGIPVLHFSQENTQKCFNAMVFGGDTKYDQRKVGARRLLTAKKHFDGELADLFDKDADAAEHLNKYVYQVFYSLQLVEIDCSQDSDAFQIFESLNATGVPLTPAEQVKNLVLMRSGSKDVSLSSWEKVVESVGEDNLVEFLAQFMFCRENHRVSRKDIYREFKETLKTYKVSALLGDMSEFANIYRSLRNPTAGLASTSSLEDLGDLGQRQAYVPLLLAASRFGVNSKEFAKISDAVLVFIVRHQVCSQSTNKLDVVFSSACEVIKNEANGVDDIIAFFKEKQMEDEAFQLMFKDLSFPYTATAQRKARVYLKRIEEKAKGSNIPLQLQSSDLSVEHIIPKQPSIEQLEGWIGKENADELRSIDPKLDDFSEQTIMRIGNLALLYTPENSSANNKDYLAKRKCYSQAVVDKDGNNRGIPAEVFTLIRELLDEYVDEFTADSVVKRSEELASKAVQAWK